MFVVKKASYRQRSYSPKGEKVKIMNFYVENISLSNLFYTVNSFSQNNAITVEGCHTKLSPLAA